LIADDQLDAIDKSDALGIFKLKDVLFLNKDIDEDYYEELMQEINR